MFQLFNGLRYFKVNKQLDTIPENYELFYNDYEYQRFEDINDKSLEDKFKKILKKIKTICLQIKFSIIKIWESFILKKKSK